MNHPLKLVSTIGVAAMLTAACNATPNSLRQTDAARQIDPTIPGKAVNDAELPINQRFRTLDEYLAWLRQYAAPTDRAWYKEIKPGVYELQTDNFRPVEGMPGAVKRIFTREELERQFGFKS